MKNKSVLILTIGLTVSFIYLQSYFFALNDWITSILILLSAIIIFLTVFETQLGHKRILRVHSKEYSWLYHFFSDKKSFLIIIFSIIISLLFAVITSVLMKSIVIDYGDGWVIGGMLIISLLVFLIITPQKTASELINENLHPDITQHISRIMYMLIVAMSLNVILSFGLSFIDTDSFINSQVGLDNFTDKSLESFVLYNGDNYYTKVITNMMILINNAKVAIGSILIDSMVQKQDYRIYIFIGFFLINLFKLSTLVLSMVFLQEGFEKLARKFLIKTRQLQGTNNA